MTDPHAAFLPGSATRQVDPEGERRVSRSRVTAAGHPAVDPFPFTCCCRSNSCSAPRRRRSRALWYGGGGRAAVARYNLEQMIELHGLLQIFLRVQLRELLRHPRVRGEQHDGNGSDTRLLLLLLAELEAITARHHPVEENETRKWIGAKIFERLKPIRSRADRVPFGLEHIGQRVSNVEVVVHHEHVRLLLHAERSMGKSTTNRVPPSEGRSKRMVPVWASTICRAIHSPRPKPP